MLAGYMPVPLAAGTVPRTACFCALFLGAPCQTLCHSSDYKKRDKFAPYANNAYLCTAIQALGAKLADAPDLGSGDFGRVGSSPIRRTHMNEIC